MANFTLKNGQEVVDGTNNKDVFFGNEDNFDAGDIINGLDGDDTFRFFADGAGGTFGAFELNSVETIEVTNDAAAAVVFDMSGSFETAHFAVNNSSQSVTFTQVAALLPETSLDIINTTTVGTTDVELLFRNGVVAGGNDSVTVNVKNTDVDTLHIGRVAAAGLDGIENITLNVTGNQTTIQTLDSDLTSLNITGSGNILINDSLNATVRSIDASTATGALDISFTAATSGVTFNGSQGNNTAEASAFDDTVTTYAGNDTLDLGGGNNVADAGDGNNLVVALGGADTITTGSGTDFIDAGAGNNVITAGNGSNTIFTGNGSDTITGGRNQDFVFSGDGTDTITTLAGNDTISVGGGRHFIEAGRGADTLIFGANLDASVDAFGNPIGDIVNGGSGRDTLSIEALGNGANSDAQDDARFDQVRSIETLQITTAGKTYLGGANSVLGRDNAQNAGIRRIDLYSSGDDVVDASTFTRALVVNSFGFGSDTVTTGDGNDVFNFYNNLDDTDDLNAGKGARGDKLSVTGSTTLTTASMFQKFEILELQSGYATNGFASVYNITLDNDNASSTGTLTVNAKDLRASPFGDETLTFDGSAATSYRFVINSGAANDVLQGGALSDEVHGGRGSDTITAVGGDTVTGDAGNDTINLLSGNNVADGGSGRDTITLGTGSDTVNGGVDNDLIVSGSGSMPDQIDQNDVIDGGVGDDTLRVQGAFLTDVDFTGLSNVETLQIQAPAGGFVQIGAEAQAGGIRTVDLNGAADGTLDASAYTVGLRVDAEAGGADNITTGSGADTVLAGVGAQTIALDGGADTVIVDGSELDAGDTIFGGAGVDTIVLDNDSAVGDQNPSGDGTAVSAMVDLDQVRDVERYTLLDDGTDPNSFFGNNADTYTVSFTGTVAGGVGSLTDITVDTSVVTDVLDTTQVTLEAGLADADYQFTVLGSSATTEVFKLNNGVNNNINFTGGSGVDRLYIDGSDLGSTTIFDGRGGQDAVFQTGGLITDDSYSNVSNVELLVATGADNVDAILGSRASASGLVRVVFDNNNSNSVVLDQGFNTPLSIVLGGGNDTVTANASAAALTFIGDTTEFTAGDALEGGNSAGDVAEVHIVGGNDTADFTNVTGVEMINFVDDYLPVFENTHLILNTAAGDVAGGVQTINAANTTDAYYIDAAGATADLAVNLSEGTGATEDIDVVVTGSGDDQIDLGDEGFAGDTFGIAPDTTLDYVLSGDGDDTVTGQAGRIATGSGNDTVTIDSDVNAGNSEVNLGDGADTATMSGGDDKVEGDGGNDMLSGDGGNDVLSGGAGVDSILGGNGADAISGGLGKDTLSGGDGSDLFFYGSVGDSATPDGRDVITDFASGVDQIDFRNLMLEPGLDLGNIVFRGNQDNFADAQGSVLAGSGLLQVVYETDRNVLWVDANDDGTLDANDVQIQLTGVSSILGSDVFAGAGTPQNGQMTFDATYGLNTPFFANDLAMP